MKQLVGAMAGLVTIFTSYAAMAETINVAPGLNTLRAAVNNAAAGDILVLESGSYRLASTDDMLVDKSLTIRAINAAATPVIYFEGSSRNTTFAIEGDGTDFILQGITLQRHNNAQAQLVVRGNVSSVALLENYFPNIYFSTQQVTDNDGNIATVDKLIVVGNTMSGTSSQIVSWGAEQEFLFAGNKLNYTTLGTANYGAEQNIIGNNFIQSASTSLTIGDSHYARVIGNTFVQNHSFQTATSVSAMSFPVIARLTGRGDFSNNIVKQGLNPFSATGTPNNYRTIYTNGSDWTLSNNIFEQNQTILNSGGGNYPAFSFNSKTVFKNNVITGNLQPVLFELNGMEAQNFTLMANNLCFETEASCPDNNGNLNDKDPLFVDTVSYELDTLSPAIDAGLESDVYKDVDGSRTDIGAQGGVYPIAQFTAQLDSNATAPYFYPLFEANSSLSNTGELTVKAVAIARQQ